MQVVPSARAAGRRSTLRLRRGCLGYWWAPTPPLLGLPAPLIVAEQPARVLDWSAGSP